MVVTRAAQQWLPAKYLAFERLRLRPALELLGRVPRLSADANAQEGVRIVDLGAGTGNMAPAFLERWPSAHVTFVDSSASMLERAQADHKANDSLDTSRFTYEQASFESFEPREPLDLVYSNAALQWVNSDVHKTLLPRLFSFLKPGGVLAFQIPDTRTLPSHQLMAKAAEDLGWLDDVKSVRWITCDYGPDFYYEIFHELMGEATIDDLDMWSTTYAQIMEGETPVADFTASTTLGPYLEALGGRGSPRANQYEAKYRELIAAAYPKQSDGRTVFNYKRFFAVATKPLA